MEEMEEGGQGIPDPLLPPYLTKFLQWLHLSMITTLVAQSLFHDACLGPIPCKAGMLSNTMKWPMHGVTPPKSDNPGPGTKRQR